MIRPNYISKNFNINFKKCKNLRGKNKMVYIKTSQRVLRKFLFYSGKIAVLLTWALTIRAPKRLQGVPGPTKLYVFGAQRSVQHLFYSAIWDEFID